MEIGSISKIKVPHGRKIDISSLQIKKNVPKDQSFCEVKLVRSEDDNYALKIIHKAMIQPSKYEEQYNRLENQIQILYKLNHPNIIKLHFHEETEDCIYLLMEYGGTRLGGSIRKKKFDEEEIRNFVKQIVNALQHIHEEGCVHRDLSPDNILINRDNQIKIVDFGFSNDLTGRHTKLGDFFFMAPEIDGQQQYNHKADIWSLGIITFEMFHQDLPFCPRKQYKDFNAENFIFNRNLLKINMNPALSKQAADFIRKLLVLRPDERPNAVELLEHPFLKENQEPDASFNFQEAAEKDTEDRKTSKKDRKNIEVPQEKEAEQIFIQDGIGEQQRSLRWSIGQIFASLHNQKELLSSIISNYQQLLATELQKR